MYKVSIRELTHNFSKYLKLVKTGGRLVLLERNKPVADIVPHNENLSQPGWKRSIEKLSLRGESVGSIIARNRKDNKS